MKLLTLTLAFAFAFTVFAAEVAPTTKPVVAPTKVEKAVVAKKHVKKAQAKKHVKKEVAPVAKTATAPAAK